MDNIQLIKSVIGAAIRSGVKPERLAGLINDSDDEILRQVIPFFGGEGTDDEVKFLKEELAPRLGPKEEGVEKRR